MIGVFVANKDGKEVTFLANDGVSIEDELNAVAKASFEICAVPDGQTLAKRIASVDVQPIFDESTYVINRSEEQDAHDNAAIDKADAVRKLNNRIMEAGLKLITGSAEAVMKSDGEEERFVLSMVLEPNDGDAGVPLNPDTQGDVYSADEIRKTAHSWMENYGQVDLQHSFEALEKQDVCVLETYLAPADFTLGEQTVVKGTWLLALRVGDDTLWQGVKSGEIGAFSIGGAALRTPIEDDTDAVEADQ